MKGRYGLDVKEIASNLALWAEGLPAREQEMAVRLITRDQVAAWSEVLGDGTPSAPSPVEVAKTAVRRTGPPHTSPGANAADAEGDGA